LCSGSGQNVTLCAMECCSRPRASKKCSTVHGSAARAASASAGRPPLAVNASMAAGGRAATDTVKPPVAGVYVSRYTTVKRGSGPKVTGKNRLAVMGAGGAEAFTPTPVPLRPLSPMVLVLLLLLLVLLPVAAAEARPERVWLKQFSAIKPGLPARSSVCCQQVR